MSQAQNFGSERFSVAEQAQKVVEDLFREAGWSLIRPIIARGDAGLDLLIQKGEIRYAVQIKVSSEGRADRVVPLWAQAYLEALRAAPAGWLPLTIVVAPTISDRVADQVLTFARSNAPSAAIGIIDLHGRRQLEGDALETLTVLPRPLPTHPSTAKRANLFSDINQWLLKVLLAPYLKPDYTTAPRGEYLSATELGRAAKVSVMSAFRLVEALRADGHLDGRSRHLHVVRRRELLERWRSWSSSRTPHELPAVFILPGDRNDDLRAITDQPKVGACLALFAAADALGLGFVRGALPHIYLPKLTPTAISNLAGVMLAAPHETPQLLLRDAPALQSVFRGTVKTEKGLATDVLQTWLDVSSHLTRGREQADMIERQALSLLVND